MERNITAPIPEITANNFSIENFSLKKQTAIRLLNIMYILFCAG